MDIVSIVVTFNRKEMLLRNLGHQLSQSVQPKKIVVVDNASTDGTYAFLAENGVFESGNVAYYRLEENSGGAGGFEQGLRYASGIEADAYLLMDDDGFMFRDDTLEKLIAHIPEDPLYVVNSWLVFDTERPVYASSAAFRDGVIPGFISPFNSTLFSRALVEKIGFPNGQYFIRGDEVDYTMRAREAGATLLTVCDSVYYHPQFCKGEKRFLFLKFYNTYDAPWKEYYQVRNSTYNFRKRSRAVHAYFSYRKYRFGLRLFSVPNKKIIRKFMKLGYKHGKKGILGKTVLPGQKELPEDRHV